MDPSITPLGRKLNSRMPHALAVWEECKALSFSTVRPEVIEEFERLNLRPLIWRLWELAIEEATKLYPNR